MIKHTLTLLALTTALTPAAADAAVRHVAPDGLGGNHACTKQVPCTINSGFFWAADGDEVVVTPGEYTVDAPIDVQDRQVTITGRATNGVRPVLRSTVGGGSTTLALSADSVVRDVDIVQAGGAGFALTGGALLERVRIDLAADFARAIVVAPDVTIRDSVIHGTGANQSGIRTPAGVTVAPTEIRLRNVTAIVDGPSSLPLGASSMGEHGVTVDARASILRGRDVDASVGSWDDAPAHLRLRDSNTRYGTPADPFPAFVIDEGGNTQAEPLFADRAAGDLRPAAGSPTIDAGSTDAHSGTKDLANLPRVQGTAADVGAHEQVVAPGLAFVGTPEIGQDRITAAGRITAGAWPAALWGLELAGPEGVVAGQRTYPLMRSEMSTTFEGLAPDTAYTLRIVTSGPFGENVIELPVRTAAVPAAGEDADVAPQPTPVTPVVAPVAPPEPATTQGPVVTPAPPTATRTKAKRDRTAPKVRVRWQKAGVRVTVSEQARVTIRLRARGGRTVRTRIVSLRRGTTSVRVAKVTKRVCSARVVAVDRAGNRTTRTFTRRCGS